MAEDKGDSSGFNISLEDMLAYGLLLVIAIYLLIFSSGFQHIPSPIYGGDFYMARGFTQAILQGHAPWLDPYFPGYYAYYGWLSYVITAGITAITGLGLERVSVLLPAVLEVIYLYVSFLFGSAIFKGKRYGLLFMTLSFAFRPLDMKISSAVAILFMLLSLYFWMRFEQGERKYKYLMGLCMGLTALAHIVTFIALVGLIGVVLAVEFAIKLWHEKKTSVAVHFVKRYGVAFAIAGVVALALVGPWIFVYHLKTVNPTQQYSLQDISNVGVGWVIKSVWDTLFRFSFSGFGPLVSSLPQAIFGLLIVGGILFCYLNRDKMELRYALAWFAAAIILAGHFLVTIPLFNNWITPGQLWGASIWLVDLVMIVFGVKLVELVAAQAKVPRAVVLGVVVVLCVIVAAQNFSGIKADRWIQYGRQMDSGTKIMFDTESWMLANTGTEDVFLANDESAFALNALAGRYVVTVRRTHASYYVDIEKRYADAMVMLYGNNSAVVRQLLSEYKVDYLYMDSFLMSYPMITSLKYQNYLAQNGINYTVQRVRLDPSTDAAPQYLSLVVPPQDLRILKYNITQPVKQFIYTDEKGQQQLHSMFLKVTV